MSDELNILLVEDDEEDIVILRKLLAAHPQSPGMKLHPTGSLSEALQRISEGGIDTVLLDLSLPDSQGESTFDRLHEHSPLIPVIILTGQDSEETALSTVQKGAQDYLVKGNFQTDALVRSIRYAVERCRLIRELEERMADLRESRRGLDAIINSNIDAMIIVNRDGIVEFANASAERMFACNVDELIGHRFGTLFPSQAPVELGILHGATDHIIAEMKVIETAWRHAVAQLVLLRDISQQKRTEEALKLYRDHLKELVQRRTEQLSKANDELNIEIRDGEATEQALRESVRQLEANSRAQLDFVSNVSHELKTPLASIGYAVSNLLAGVAGPMPAPIKSYMVMIDEDIERLGGTINDILDMSRIEAKTLALRQVKLHLSRLILHTISSIQDMASARKQRITFFAKHDRSFVAVDPKRIERVIVNIVGNSIKFTPEGGLIEVRLFSKPSDTKHVYLTISDTGIGIGPEHLDLVTQRYYRVGEHVDGTGLGLALCKEITELHGGTLSVQSPPTEHPHGTQINITLPSCPPPSVLVVDDEPLILSLVARQLEPHGYDIIRCTNGKEALELVETRQIDCIIADIMLPQMDGIELISRIKTGHKSEAMPVVVITGSDLDTAAAEVLDGFDIPVLKKPWKGEELMAAIEDTAAGRHFQRGNAE